MNMEGKRKREEVSSSSSSDNEGGGYYSSSSYTDASSSSDEEIRRFSCPIKEDAEKSNADVLVAVIDSGADEGAHCFGDSIKFKKGFLGTSLFDARESKDVADKDGHGTECASILCGLPIGSKYGHLREVKERKTPSPKIAIYKAPLDDRAAIRMSAEAAIQDKVDFISLSMGSIGPPSQGQRYLQEPYIIPTFEAMREGILTFVACGNKMKEISPIENTFLWGLGIGSSTSQLKIVTKLKFENPANEIEVYSVNIHPDHNEGCPLVNAKDVKKVIYWKDDGGTWVEDWEFKKGRVKGKIVVFDATESDDQYQCIDRALEAEAAGIIFIVEDIFSPCDCTLRVVCVTKTDGDKILKYMQDHKGITAKICRSEEVLDEKFPTLGDISARDVDDILCKYFLKPDVCGFGIHVLVAALNEALMNKDLQSFIITSGTSYATPMVCGSAVYVKVKRSHWPNSWIKSALITSTTPFTEYATPADILAGGSGLVDQYKAIETALVYETTINEYCAYIQQIKNCDPILLQMSKGIYDMSKNEKIELWDINYPSFKTTLENGVMEWDFKRRLKLIVDAQDLTWTAHAEPSPRCKGKFEMKVDRPDLTFRGKLHELSFVLKIKVNSWEGMDDILDGTVAWKCPGYQDITSMVVVVRQKN